MPINITESIEDAVRQFEDIQPSIEDYTAIIKWAKNRDATLKLDRQFYKGRSLKLWDVVREYPAWKSENEPSEPSPLVEDDPNKLVLWTRHIGEDGYPTHPGTPRDHWWLYELMPLSEAQTLHYDDIIPPASRNEMCNFLEALADGRLTLPKEAQRIVAIA